MAQATLNRVLDDIKTLELEELQKVEQAIHARLPQQSGTIPYPMTTLEQIEAANSMLRKTIVMLPNITGTDNESIDADLAREYGDDHSVLYRSGGAA